MRLLLDQGVPSDTAGALREAGWDVVHVKELGMSTASDAEILARASLDSRVVVTFESGLSRITGRDECGTSIGDPNSQATHAN